jgi:hypothetical protein
MVAVRGAAERVADGGAVRAVAARAAAARGAAAWAAARED